ncbi:lasso peptide biosynthesis B2 protein [Paenactinomyces guangxiensis]|uniref:Lasso peptide biosynthesis B2 protein n=1 Tax=Paenactinomyces guangxiensis TaxID=1490290 RepID=A0A7W2A6V1_9BACL|nr:lasso peptide biosynthesis B2 protein [Paenactinomyces guangxiensis]MBA4493816.1 lasso peptide biosynthesis B2 protein [Paenactinomyces guangxiensis]MBH8591282.1 lasso peptide biosynthesis B2 protein [Paenactinomyces guangxiensis]
MGVKMALDPRTNKGSWTQDIMSSVSLVTAVILMRCCSLYRIEKLLRRFKKGCTREMSMQEAEKVWESIRKCSVLLFFTRVACLETSLAFMICALLKRRKAEWCIGVTIGVFESHAWIEVAGVPVREPDYVMNQMKKILVV